MMLTLIDLPREILLNIFRYIDPLDLGILPRVCRDFKRSILGNSILFKEVYDMTLDPCYDSKPADVENALKDYVLVRRMMDMKKPIEDKVAELPFVAQVITRLLQTASLSSSRNVSRLQEWFEYDEKCNVGNKDNLEAYLSQSMTYMRAQQLQAMHSKAIRQASAKLHVLYGKPRLALRRQKYKSPYPFAVSMVYDLRNYTEETLWGPYLPDRMASADWEKLEAVMVVLGHNLQWFTYQTHGAFKAKWKEPFIESRPYSYASDDIVPPGTYPDLDFDDPYNVTGAYTRVVCFLDYHDLFRYNFAETPPPDEPRPPLEDEEAIRLIKMHVKAIRREEPGPDDHPDWPVIYFEGWSRSLHHNTGGDPQSKLKGSVRMTKEGEVRWQSVSVYGSEERWGSEGIQVGGIQSARGVLGHWFDREHRDTGPVGPTAFWKTSDLLTEKLWDDDWDNDDDDEDDADYAAEEEILE